MGWHNVTFHIGTLVTHLMQLISESFQWPKVVSIKLLIRISKTCELMMVLKN